MERKMPKMKNLFKWEKAIRKYGKVIDVVENYMTVGLSDENYKINLYTFSNKYTIIAKCPVNGTSKKNVGYLGCTVSSRKYRPGETWFRGNDLSDGRFSKKTWHSILADIVAFELHEIVQKDQTPSIPLQNKNGQKCPKDPI